MGFIGQNGAGKTTTIRSVLNIIPVDNGEIKLLGLDYLKNEQEIKERIAVVFDELPFHDIFNEKDMARIFEGIYPQWSNAEYSSYLERFGLPAKKKIGDFSKGMKVKLQIGCALSHSAELLVMDEAILKLNSMHIDYIFSCLKENPSKVRNIKSYLKTVLYNAAVTIDNYYTSAVNHDMYGTD